MTSSQEQGCVFCKIIDRELPASIAYEDEHTIGIPDIRQAFGRGTIVTILKKHVEQFYDLDDEDIAILFQGVKEVARKLKRVFQPDFVGTISRGQQIKHVHIIMFPAWDIPQPGDAMERATAILRDFREDESLARIPESELDEIADQIRNAVP